MIEKNLIQFWHDKNQVPLEISEAMANSKRNNSNYKVLQVDDNYMFTFIKKHYGYSILKLYELNAIPASRSDMARLLLLYEFGGVYVDASIELQKSLDTVINRNLEVVLLQKDSAKPYRNCPEKAHVTNSMIAAKRKSPFVKWCIERFIENLVSGDHNHRVITATGPEVLNQALVIFNKKLNIKKMSFSKLNNRFFKIRRVEGVNNSWVILQRDGLIDPVFYEKNRKSYSKLVIWGKWIIHFSFRFLSIKD